MNDKPLEEMTFNERVDWATRLAFDGLITGGTRGLRSAIFSAFTAMAFVDAKAGSKWAVRENS